MDFGEFGKLSGFRSDFVKILLVLETELNCSPGSCVKLTEDTSGSAVFVKFGLRLELEVGPKNDSVVTNELVDASADLK